MKYILAFFLATLSLCLADAPPDDKPKAQLPTLRTEHTEKRDKQGQVIRYVDTVYRGNERVKKERILRTVKFKKENQEGWAIWRTFYVDGQAVMGETDDGDGKPPMVIFYKDNIPCEMFKRQPDGSVEAVSSEELAQLKGQVEEFLGGFEKVLDKVIERTKTNSVEKVMEDLKADIKQYEQQQKQTEDKNKK